MIWMESIQFMVYLCSPRVTNLQDLMDRGMHLSDIALHDITRDLVLFNQQREAEVSVPTCFPISIEFFHNGSKGQSVKSGGGKTNELLCRESWWIV